MSDVLISKLDSIRRKYSFVALSSSLTAAIGLWVLALSAGMLLDWWLDLGFASRACMLGVNVAGAVAVIVWFGLVPILFLPDEQERALWVEKVEARFGSRLISAVQFMRAEAIGAGVSPSMIQRMVLETEAIAGPMDFASVVKTDRLRRLMVITGIAIAAVIGGGVYGGATSWALLQRAMLVPGVEVPRKTSIDCLTKSITVAKGEAVSLSAIAGGAIPTGGIVHVRFDGGMETDFPLSVDPSVKAKFSRGMEAVQDSFSYSIFLGDNHTPTYRVEAAVRPAVAGIECTQLYPAYTHLPAQHRQPGDLSLLAGSRLQLQITANKPLKISSDVTASHIHFHGSEVDFPLRVDINNLAKASAESIPVPAGTTGFTAELVDGLGVRSKDSAFYRIDLLPDHPPSVRIIYPEQKETTVTPIATPTIGLEAADDFAIGKLALRYRITRAGENGGNPDDVNGLIANYFPGLNFTGKPVTRIDSAIDFDWLGAAPAAGIVAEEFSVRWVGSIKPPYTDDYVFRCDVHGGIRIMIGGKPVLLRWPGGGNDAEGLAIHLEAGKLYPIRVDYRPAYAAAKAVLMWRSRRQQQEVVPHSALFRGFDPTAIPGSINLAETKLATQSSTMRTATADRAADGFIDGEYGHGSVSQTDNDLHAWWQVDLGAVNPIDKIEIYNRLDEGRDRLKDFYVFVSDVPFVSQDLSETQAQQGVLEVHVPQQAGVMTTVAVNRTGRYVRVQLGGKNFLQLAEVKVLAPARMVEPNPSTEADGLVGYWPFDEADEGFAADVVGQAVGVVYGAERAAGKIGKAMDFAKADQRVEIPASPGMDFVASDSFTLSAWVNVRGVTTSRQRIISKRAANGKRYGLMIDNHGRFSSDSTNNNIAATDATVGWHLVTLVQDGVHRTRTIYVDGVAGQSGMAMDGDNGGTLVFGQMQDHTEPFDGMLDDVLLYARALVPSEIIKMFQNPMAVHVPSPAELARRVDDSAERVDLDLAGEYPKSLRRRFGWELSKLPATVAVGDNIEFWAEAVDTNDVTGPGVGESEHFVFHVISESDKREELLGKLGDYLGKIHEVSESEKELNAKLGEMISPEKH